MNPIEKLNTVSDLFGTAAHIKTGNVDLLTLRDLKVRVIRDRTKLLGKRFEEMKPSELAEFEFMADEAKKVISALSTNELSSMFGVPFSDSSKKFNAVYRLSQIARGASTQDVSIDELRLALSYYQKFAESRNIALPAEMRSYMLHVKERAAAERKQVQQKAAAAKQQEAAAKLNRQIEAQKIVELHFRDAAQKYLPHYEKVFGPNYTPQGEYAPASIKSVKRGPEMDHEAANGLKGNPWFKENLDPFTHNCQTCVVIYELRRRGYDVQAVGWQKDLSNPCYLLSQNYMAAWIDPNTGLHPTPLFDASVVNSKACMNWLERTVEEGKRYILYVSWKKQDAAHVVHVYRKAQGNIVIYDPQTGHAHETQDQLRTFLGRVEYDKTFSPQLLRCDNLLLNIPVIKKIAKKKDGLEPY